MASWLKQGIYAGTATMDSDDDEIPPPDVLARGALPGRIRMRNNSVFQMAVSVYDIRGKHGVVQSKEEYFDVAVDPSTGIPDKSKLHLAAHYGLNEECVYSTPEKDSAVLHDNTDLLIFFIHFHINQEEASSFPYPQLAYFAQSRNSVGCIGLDPNTSIGSLKSVIRNDNMFNMKGKCPCLFHKGKRCDEDSTMVRSLFTNGDVVACYAKSDVMIQCFHMPRLNVELKYEFACFSTDNVSEMKQAFKKSHRNEFPDLALGIDDVWFSVGKQLLEDEEYFSLNLQRRRSQIGRLVLHVKHASSFPVTLKMNSQEHSSQIMMIAAPVTTAELREDVSLLIKQPANAVHLYTKNKKLKEMVLSESVGIHPKGVVSVKVAKKIQILVSLNSDGSTLPVQLFKLDSVLRLKEILQEHTNVTVSQLQLFFDQNELENERLMQDYRIRDDDIIDAYVFSKPEFVVVRQPGREPLHLTIDGLQCSIGRLKEYLANALGCSYVIINLIHRGRCLQDDDTLEQSGLVSGSTVLIPRLATQDQSTNERILEVYISQEDGTFQIAFAKKASGILFYAPESVRSDTFEKHTKKLGAQDKDYRRGIMLRRLCEDIHPELCNPKPVHKKELILQQGSGPLTPRSDALAKRISSRAVQSLRKHPHGLLHAHLDLTGYHSHPESRPLKRCMYFNELSETKDRYIYREESTIDVCKSNADEVLPQLVHTPSVTSPEKAMSGSPEHVSHRLQSLQSPAEVIQDSVLRAVSNKLCHDWKQVALGLGLESSDIDDIEYRHSRHLREQAWQALTLWKKRNSRNATIANLKQVLYDCDQTLTADSIDETIKYESV